MSLDLSTISFKPREAYVCSPKKDRQFHLIEPPTFYPSEEEFQNTYEYIEEVAEKTVDFGIVKIVPPASWNPRFALDTGVSRFFFFTQIDSNQKTTNQ